MKIFIMNDKKEWVKISISREVFFIKRNSLENSWYAANPLENKVLNVKVNSTWETQRRE